MTPKQLAAAIREDGIAAQVPGVPRMSSILARLKPAFTEAQKRKGAVSMPRGTLIHEIIEKAINAGEPWRLPEDMDDHISGGVCAMEQELARKKIEMPSEDELISYIKGSLESWLVWWRAYSLANHEFLWFAEVPLGSVEWPLRGTCDLLGVRRTIPFRQKDAPARFDLLLVDWKSGASVYESYPPQLVGYKMLVQRSLAKRGFKDFTCDVRCVLLDPDGSLPITASGHQRDVVTVRECHAWWVERYATDPDFRSRFDYGTEMEFSRMKQEAAA